MSILSDFLIGDDAVAKAYNGVADFPAEDRCQVRHITPLEAAGLLSVFRGGGDRIKMTNEFSLITPQNAEAWTMRIPTDMVTSLAGIEDAKMPEVAKACADVTREELHWSQKDFEQLLRALRNLARRAKANGKQMYLWNSL